MSSRREEPRKSGPPAARRYGDSGRHYEEEREGSADRASFQENPEVTERAEGQSNGRQAAPETDFAPVQENGDAGLVVEQRSRGASPLREENGDAMIKSPVISSEERRSPRNSRSPLQRRESGFNDAEPEERRRRRGSGSGSPRGGSPGASPRRRSPRSPRDGDDRRRRDDSSMERGGERGADRGDRDAQRDEPYTQVYVANFSRSSRRESLEEYFSKGGAMQIRDIIMKSRFAFIDYKRAEDATAAVRDFDRTEFEGKQLIVQQSYPDGSRRRKRITGPQQADECWTCGKRGHWANDCESRYRGGRDGDARRGDRGGDRGGDMRRRSNSRGRRSRSPPPRQNRDHHRDQRRSRSRSGEGRSKELREGRCFICHEKGHIKRDCPQNRGNDRGGGHRGRPMSRGYGGRDDHRGERNNYRERNNYHHHHRRSPSRSRSPPRDYRRGGHDMERRMVQDPPRRHFSRSPDNRYVDRD